MHAGALVQHNRYGEEPITPLAVTPKGEQLERYGGSGEFATPRRMTREEIEHAQQGFIDAATRAHEAGSYAVKALTSTSPLREPQKKRPLRSSRRVKLRARESIRDSKSRRTSKQKKPKRQFRKSRRASA